MNTINGNGKLQSSQPVSRQIMFVLIGTAILLLVPLVAMRFTNEVAWDGFDFAVAGVLLAGTGITYVLAARMLGNARYKMVLGIGLLLAFLLVWAELAVGIFGSPFAGS